MRLVLVLVLLATATGCGLGGSACESAVRESSEISAMEDTVSDLDRAIEECATLAEFEAAAEQFPDALDGVDASGFIANRCSAEPALEQTALCQEVSQ